MRRWRITYALAATAALVLAGSAARAATLFEAFGGEAVGFATDGFAQSFPMPAGGGANRLTGFEFVGGFGEPMVTGANTLYFFDRLYDGPIGDVPGLSIGGAEGLVGVGRINGDARFEVTSQRIVLMPDAIYFAAAVEVGTIFTFEGVRPTSSGDLIPGGSIWIAENGSLIPLDGDLGVRVIGEPVPEQSTGLLMLAGLGITAWRRRRTVAQR